MALLREGYQVYGGVRNPPSRREHATTWAVKPFTHPKDFDELLQDTKTLIHCASSSTVASSSSRPVHEFDSDLRTSLALIEALEDRRDIHVVFLSSGGTVYGRQMVNTPIDEKTTPSPISYHGASKLSVEHFFQAWATQNCTALTILRPSNIFGPGQPYTQGFGVIPALFRSVFENRKFTIRGSLDSVRDYLYIDDFIDLLHRIGTSNSTSGPVTYNAGRGTGTSLRELIALVESICGSTIEVSIEQPLKGEISHVILSSEAAEKSFEWTSRTSLHFGLEETWRWWQLNRRQNN